MRTPKVWEIYSMFDRWFVRGLPNWLNNGDTMLVYEYESGEVSSEFPVGPKMVSALYDLRQCAEGIEDGDTFEVDGRPVARVDGIHVVEV